MIIVIQKIKNWLEDHPKEYELLRYLIAGGLTTLLSLLISYGMEFLLATKPPRGDMGLISWVIACINSATLTQVSISNAVSWVVAVLFAFWINRSMVFHAETSGKAQIGKELAQFAGGRLVSFFVFEEGMAALLKLIGVPNFINRLIVLVVVMIFNYVVSKFWIFKKKEEEAK